MIPGLQSQEERERAGSRGGEDGKSDPAHDRLRETKPLVAEGEHPPGGDEQHRPDGPDLEGALVCLPELHRIVVDVQYRAGGRREPQSDDGDDGERPQPAETSSR